MVFERDNYTCQKCLMTKNDISIHCHHIWPLNENPVESADIDTCITLCKDCHKRIHMKVAGCKYNELKCSK
ncbi:MAG: HNH endonuclease [archaeon]